MALQQANREPALMPQVVTVTQRQYEIVELLASGLTNEEIADQLCIEYNTLKNYLTMLYGLLGIAERDTKHPRPRAYAMWLLLSGRVELRVVERRGRGDEREIKKRPTRLDFTALIDPDADPDFERRRLLTAFERFLDGRLG